MQKDGLMSMQDVAKMLNVPVSTLRHWRLNHIGPHSFKVEGRIRYRPETITKYIEQQEQEEFPFHPEIASQSKKQEEVI
jgi:Helix-turn-helix domain